jgi:hypothetical protein
LSLYTPMARCPAVHPERNQPTRIFGAENGSPYVKDAFIVTWLMARKRPSIPPIPGPKPPPTTRSPSPPAHGHRLPAPDNGRAPNLPAAYRSPLRQPLRRQPSPSASEADAFYASITPDSVDADAAGHAAGAGRDVVDQAVLLLRRRPLAGRTRGAPHGQRLAQGRAQPPMVPHDQRRHHLHARQVGISLVRRLGPGLPQSGRWSWSTPTSPKSS